MKAMFNEHCKSVLYTLKLRLLIHMVEDVELFGCLEMLDWLLFEKSNAHIKPAYRRRSH